MGTASPRFEVNFKPVLRFDHDELVVILERNGFTNLHHRVDHDCGMTGYTREGWYVEDEDGHVHDAENAVHRILRRRLYGLLTAEP